METAMPKLVNGRKRILPAITPKDPRWKVPHSAGPFDLCYLLVQVEPLNRLPVASRINTDSDMFLDRIDRDEWCVYREQCLDEAAAHEDGHTYPRIKGMKTWVCAKDCPYRNSGRQPLADAWARTNPPEQAETPASIVPVPQTAYAVLQAMALVHVGAKRSAKR